MSLFISHPLLPVLVTQCILFLCQKLLRFPTKNNLSEPYFNHFIVALMYKLEFLIDGRRMHPRVAQSSVCRDDLMINVKTAPEVFLANIVMTWAAETEERERGVTTD